MSGKMCTGATTNNAALPHQSRAYCEGVIHRAASSTAAKTEGPHDGTGSEAETAWEAGFDDAADAAGTVVTLGCCAPVEVAE